MNAIILLILIVFSGTCFVIRTLTTDEHIHDFFTMFSLIFIGITIIYGLSFVVNIVFESNWAAAILCIIVVSILFKKAR